MIWLESNLETMKSASIEKSHGVLLGAIRLTEGGARSEFLVDSSAEGGCGSGSGRD